jgi:hypothetical protein
MARTKPILNALLIAGLLTTAQVADALLIAPSVVGGVRDDGPLGSADSTQTHSSLLQVMYWNLSTLRIQHGIVEFDLSSVTGTVVAASLSITVQSQGGDLVQSADFHAYEGDGSLTLADYAVGTYQGTITVLASDPSPRPPSTITIDPAIVEAARAGSGYLAINIRLPAPDPATYNTVNFYNSTPRLDVTVPEPSTLALLAPVLVVSSLARRRKASR